MKLPCGLWARQRDDWPLRVCQRGWCTSRPVRTLTSWPSVRTDVRNAGGTLQDHEVVIDRNLVSSRTPDDLPAFRAVIVEEFARSPGAVACG